MFKGMSNLGDLSGLFKQAQEMQAKLKAAQEEVENLSVEGEAGGGLVRAMANGKGAITKLEIDASILREDSKEITEDLILAAIRDAQARASERAARHMSELTGGMELPEGVLDMFGGKS